MTTPHPDHDSTPAPPQRPSPDRQTPRQRSGTGPVVDWIAWHLPELAGIGAPLVGVWLISAWCALVAAAVAAWWAVHELRATVTATTVGAGTAVVRAVATPTAGGGDTGKQAHEETGQNA